MITLEGIANSIAEIVPLLPAKMVSSVLFKILVMIKIIILGVISLKLGQLITEKVLVHGSSISLKERRIVTLRSILNSLIKYVVYFVTTYMIIKEFYANADAILAGAGIVGLAVGFGAQNLVRDVITGFFILLEDQFAVGEYITAAGVAGIVEEIGLRVTRLRDFSGELHIIPNGIIQQVTNHNRGSMRALVDVGISNEEDIDKALAVLNQVAKDVQEVMSDLLREGPEVLGVVAFSATEVTLRIIAKTKPMEQWRVERELRKSIKEAFDKAGIQLPYPKQITITKEFKSTDADIAVNKDTSGSERRQTEGI